MANSSAIRIDHFNKKILISKSFQKATMNPNSNEYKELAAVMANHPTYEIAQRAIKTNPKKDTYKGLTYEYMRDYIILHSTPEEEAAAVAEFDELILVSKCHSQSLRYPTIKKWFLTKYPSANEFGASALAAIA
jgi:hypothetical protein